MAHDLGDGMQGPLLARDLGQRLRADHPFQVAVGRHRKELAVVAVDVVVHPMAQVQGGRHDDRLGVHEAPHRLTLERLPDQHLLVAALGRVFQEQPDQPEPDAADEVVREELDDAEGDEQPGEPLTDAGGPARGPAQVARRAPQDRAQHAAAVEGKGGNKVEHQDRRIDPGQVAEHAHALHRPGLGHAEAGQSPEQQRQDGADDRPRNGHAELGPRRQGLSFQLRHAAEQEQRNAPYRHAPRAGDHGVSQLMQDDAREEREGRDYPHDPVFGRRSPGDLGAEDIDQAPGNQGEDDKPTGVQTDRDTQQAEEPPALTEHDAPP